MMTTKELYYKAKYLADGMSVIKLHYTIKDDSGKIQLGSGLNISFRDNIEETLYMIEKTKEVGGFMFWNLSTEGEEFFYKNRKSIGILLANIVLKQK